jgi:hypothetical protein
LQAAADLLRRRRRNEEGGGELSRKSRTTAGCDSHRISQLNFMPFAAKISFDLQAGRRASSSSAAHESEKLIICWESLFLHFAFSFLKFQLDVSET